MTSAKITTLFSWDTEYSADSVEWCPVSPYCHLFVCGTYQLVEKSNQDESASNVQKKLGRLYLFCTDCLTGLTLLQTIEMEAILDTKWCHQKVQNRILLGVANAKGEILVYELLDVAKETSCRLHLLTKTNICEDKEGVHTLSLDWSTGKSDTSIEFGPSIVVSDSLGGITLLTLTDTALEIMQYSKVHQYEAWITAFDYWNTSIIYSGGDDCKLNILDTRCSIQSPVTTNRVHEMGVTSIHCNAAHENLLISGSYDEKLRVWDTRSMRQSLTTTSLTGGVWRLKWDPRKWQYILAACMHGGFCVTELSDPAKPPSIVTEYMEHGSLAYGADWCHLLSPEIAVRLKDVRSSPDLTMIATCSFYDHKLCVSVLKHS